MQTCRYPLPFSNKSYHRDVVLLMVISYSQDTHTSYGHSVWLLPLPRPFGHRHLHRHSNHLLHFPKLLHRSVHLSLTYEIHIHGLVSVSSSIMQESRTIATLLCCKTNFVLVKKQLTTGLNFTPNITTSFSNDPPSQYLSSTILTNGPPSLPHNIYEWAISRSPHNTY